MAQKGHDVLFVCSGENSESYLHNGYRVQVFSNKWQNPFYHYINPLLLIKLVVLLTRFKPDILHVHNINLQTFSLGILLFSLKFPVVWTLHDLWALCMVGWPIPPDCIHIKEKCRNCATWPSAMVTSNKFLKETVFRLSKMSIVCPSDWMAHMLQYSLLKSHPFILSIMVLKKTFFTLREKKGKTWNQKY